MAAAPSLYRKYRPRRFADLVGQEHVTRSICNAIKAGMVSHAYLFCGPRGSGKTSLAKLIGKAVNCAELKEGEPCGVCTSCLEADAGSNLDIVEIDAASNRKIDDIRHLREQVAYGPVSGAKKVYIIDEVHMLTKEAANAFLKTLEEPPSHVVFILCTTEPQMILPTIMSRCQRFDFRKLSIDACLKRLSMVIEAEQPLDVTEEARCFLAVRGDGSMRDVLSLLDQTISFCGRSVTRADIERSLGLVSGDVLEAIVRALVGRDSSGLVRSIEEVSRAGTDMSTLLGQLIERFRALLLVKSGNSELLAGMLGTRTLEQYQDTAETVSEPRLIAILQTLSRILGHLRQGLMPVFALEVGLLEAMHCAQPITSDLSTRLALLEERISSGAPSGAAVAARGYSSTVSATADDRARQPRVSVSGDASTANRPPDAVSSEKVSSPVADYSAHQIWKRLMDRMRKEYPLTYAFVVEARFLRVEGNDVMLEFDEKHAFHKSKLEEVKHEAILKKFVSEEFGEGKVPKIVDSAGTGDTGIRTVERGRESAAAPVKKRTGQKKTESEPGWQADDFDWYERKAMKNRKVKELIESFDAEIISVD